MNKLSCDNKCENVGCVILFPQLASHVKWGVRSGVGRFPFIVLGASHLVMGVWGSGPKKKFWTLY